MMRGSWLIVLFSGSVFYFQSCSTKFNPEAATSGSARTANYKVDSLPAPNATASAKNFSKVIGWPKGKTPVPPDGFFVTRFADGLEHPRWISSVMNWYPII